MPATTSTPTRSTSTSHIYPHSTSSTGQEIHFTEREILCKDDLGPLKANDEYNFKSSEATDNPLTGWTPDTSPGRMGVAGRILSVSSNVPYTITKNDDQFGELTFQLPILKPPVGQSQTLSLNSFSSNGVAMSGASGFVSPVIVPYPQDKLDQLLKAFLSLDGALLFGLPYTFPLQGLMTGLPNGVVDLSVTYRTCFPISGCRDLTRQVTVTGTVSLGQ